MLVSGLADGLDSQAHAAALDAGELTVGVLGCAIDKTYPAANRVLRGRIERQGAVFSEYGPGAQDLCRQLSAAQPADRRVERRAGGGGSPPQKRHHEHCAPC